MPWFQPSLRPARQHRQRAERDREVNRRRLEEVVVADDEYIRKALRLRDHVREFLEEELFR